MSEYSEIIIAEGSRSPLEAGNYELIFRLVLENGEIGRHVYDFTYYYGRSALRFIELTGESCNILVRMSSEEGDTKSYDMFQLFKGMKTHLSKSEWASRLSAKFRKSLFADEWENFMGFFPFGFTLIQPPLSHLSSIAGGDFVHVVHKPPNKYLLSLLIYRHRFRTVRIYSDLVTREVLSQESWS